MSIQATVDQPGKRYGSVKVPSRKLLVGALVVVLVGLIGTGGYAYTHQTKPVAATTRTTTVAKGNIVQQVSVAGSVNAASQTKLNFGGSGRLSALYVTVGTQVSAGQALAKLDTTDLQAALTTAQNNLDAAQINYEKAVAGTSDAQASLSGTQQSTASDIAAAQQALSKLQASYGAAKSIVTTQGSSIQPDAQAFASSIEGLRIQQQQTLTDMSQRVSSDVATASNALYTAGTALVNAQSYASTQLTAAATTYTSARDAVASAIAAFDGAMAAGGDTTTASATYQSALAAYSNAANQLQNALDAPTSALSSAQSTVTSGQQAINSQSSLADGYLDQARADFAGLQSRLTTEIQLAASIKSRLSQIDSNLATITSAISGGYVSAIQNVTATQIRSAQSIQSAQSTLNNQPANVKAAQNSLEIAQTSVQTAQNNLDAATLKAPSAGVISSISAQVGELVASSSAGFMVLSNTSALVVHGTIGEGDISKLKLGQIALVTVEAAGSAKLSGKVTSIDPVATISSGVPVYGVDVTLDNAGASVKPGMTGTANVVTASAQGVLTLPNLAVKTKAGQSYVTRKKDGANVDTNVTTGLSDGTSTEIKSGVAEGDSVVISSGRTTSTQSSTTTGFPGAGAGAGNGPPAGAPGN